MSKSVTRQVSLSFNWAKISGKCRNSSGTFRVIFKQCGRDSKEPNGRPLKIFTRMGNGIFARENVNSGFDLVRFISAAKKSRPENHSRFPDDN